MTHDFNLVFDTDNELWQRVLEIFNNNEKYPKKIVEERNLHHKFPRSFSKKLGEAVDNDKDNLVSLSLSDHFLVHYYYYKLARTGFKQSMAMAFSLMAKKQLKYISPETAEMMAKDYEEAKKVGPMSEETKNKLSKAHIDKSPWNKGKSMSQETKRKMSESFKPHNHTDESRNNISNSLIRTEFGRKFKEHYGLFKRDNLKLYYYESYYYKKHGKCRWKEEPIVH